MDGQIVGLDEPFTIYTDTGEPTERKLQYPADYEADEPGGNNKLQMCIKNFIGKGVKIHANNHKRRQDPGTSQRRKNQFCADF